MSSSVLILFWVSKKISGSGTLSHFEGRAGFSWTPAFKAGMSSAFPPRSPRLCSVSDECRFQTCGCVDSHQGLGGPGTEEWASGLSWWPGYHWSFLGWGVARGGIFVQLLTIGARLLGTCCPWVSMGEAVTERRSGTIPQWVWRPGWGGQVGPTSSRCRRCPWAGSGQMAGGRTVSLAPPFWGPWGQRGWWCAYRGDCSQSGGLGPAVTLALRPLLCRP